MQHYLAKIMIILVILLGVGESRLAQGNADYRMTDGALYVRLTQRLEPPVKISPVASLEEAMTVSAVLSIFGEVITERESLVFLDFFPLGFEANAQTIETTWNLRSNKIEMRESVRWIKKVNPQFNHKFTAVEAFYFLIIAIYFCALVGFKLPRITLAFIAIIGIIGNKAVLSVFDESNFIAFFVLWVAPLVILVAINAIRQTSLATTKL